MRRGKWTLHCYLFLIVFFNFWKILECSPYSLQKLIFVVKLRLKSFNIIREFGDMEINQGQISQGKIFIPIKFGQLIKFRCDFLHNSGQLFFIIFIPKQRRIGCSNVLKNTKKTFDQCLIFKILPQEIILTKPFNDIKIDSLRFSQLEISINQVGKVGEIKSQLLFIFLEPLLSCSVFDIFPNCTHISKKKSRYLGDSSGTPIAKDHFVRHENQIVNIIGFVRFIMIRQFLIGLVRKYPSVPLQREKKQLIIFKNHQFFWGKFPILQLVSFYNFNKRVRQYLQIVIQL